MRFDKLTANVNMQEYAKWLKKNYDFTIAASAGP